jgi:hypothetical protein
MRRRGFGAAGLAGLAAILLGCGSERRYGPEDNPTTVRDVTGVEYGWSCTDPGCVVTQLATTPPPNRCTDPTASAYGFAWGRFVDLCSICLAREPGFYWSTTPGECRLLACETDAHCPAFYQAAPEEAYACVNGLCQNIDTGRFPRDVLKRIDVESLCFAVHPRGDTAAPLSPTTQEILAAIEAACPGATAIDACPLPAGCRMP